MYILLSVFDNGYEVSYSGTGAINRAVSALEKTSMIVPYGTGGTYISGLANGTEYTFTVKTMDVSGNKSEASTYAVVVDREAIKLLDGFVLVAGKAFIGTETWTPKKSYVFVSRRKITIRKTELEANL